MRLSRRAILFLVFGGVLACAPSSDGAGKELPYSIVRRYDYSYPGNPGKQRMAIGVVLDVTSIPSGPAMCETVKAIWRDGNRKWDEFTAWLYLPGMDTEGFALVAAQFNRSGIRDFSILQYSLWISRWGDEDGVVADTAIVWWEDGVVADTAIVCK